MGAELVGTVEERRRGTLQSRELKNTFAIFGEASWFASRRLPVCKGEGAKSQTELPIPGVEELPKEER